ncbi:MAG: hypothetical protein LBE56_05775 [Tannerella sp.]|jgi:TRAP-type uncharacterized transport system fused permease subunit|nr:hypothetical protein [Tannerella sp.]
MIRNNIYIFSAALVLAGAALYLIDWNYAPYIFAAGAAGVTVSYLTMPVKSTDLRTRRLQRQHIFAGIAMIVSSVFMFRHQMAWVVFLLIAAIFQLYSSFVMKDKE